jgi:uncharacterized membrane protein
MTKDRLETFTDGVFAIVVTLLVLDIKLPQGITTANLGGSLVHILSSLGTYGLSFTIIGLYWVFHHLASRMFNEIDNWVAWLNIIHIMFIGLIPFTAKYEHSFTTKFAI